MKKPRSHRPKFTERELNVLTYVSQRLNIKVTDFIRQAALEAAINVLEVARAEHEKREAKRNADDSTGDVDMDQQVNTEQKD